MVSLHDLQSACNLLNMIRVGSRVWSRPSDTGSSCHHQLVASLRGRSQPYDNVAMYKSCVSLSSEHLFRNFARDPSSSAVRSGIHRLSAARQTCSNRQPRTAIANSLRLRRTKVRWRLGAKTPWAERTRVSRLHKMDRFVALVLDAAVQAVHRLSKLDGTQVVDLHADLRP